VGRPQVIDDQEREQVYEKVAAVDVAKDSGVVCTRLPHPSRPGARQSTVWTVRARMGAVRKLGRQLARSGVEMVTLESTSDYWRIWFLCWRRAGWVSSSSTPPRPRTCRAARRRTGWTRCGWPG
jgi:hypothetical protein